MLTENKAFSETVQAGYELTTDSTKFSKVKLTPAQIESVFASSRAEDMTFYQNLVVGDFRVSRNFGNGTIQLLTKLVTAPLVQIPKDAIKVPGINQLNANAIAPGLLNYVITDVGVKIQ